MPQLQAHDMKVIRLSGKPNFIEHHSNLNSQNAQEEKWSNIYLQLNEKLFVVTGHPQHLRNQIKLVPGDLKLDSTLSPLESNLREEAMNNLTGLHHAWQAVDPTTAD
jgi:hypothetical protein